MLEEERMTAKQPNLDNKQRFQIFPTEKCRRLVDRYKQLYKLGTEKKAQPFYLYHIVLDGYTAAYWFYELCYTLDLENELAGEFMSVCIMFAKAAEGFGKNLGKGYVDVNEWKKRQAGFLGLRSRESRKFCFRQSVLGEQLLCSCDFCKEQSNLLRVVDKKTFRRERMCLSKFSSQ